MSLSTCQLYHHKILLTHKEQHNIKLLHLTESTNYCTWLSPYTEQWRCYNKALAVKQAFQKQLTEIIEWVYLNQRLNIITGILTGPLHDTITWLLQNYGRVNYSTIVEEQAALAKYLVQVHTTLTDFFNIIDKHLSCATAANVLLMKHQVIALEKKAIQKNLEQ